MATPLTVTPSKANQTPAARLRGRFPSRVLGPVAVSIVGAVLLVALRMPTPPPIDAASALQADLPGTTTHAPPGTVPDGGPTQVSVRPSNGQGQVVRDGGEIVIAFDNQPGRLAAQQLAAATDTRFVQGRELLDGLAPVSLQWRGSSRAQAWNLVLGHRIGHVVHCDDRGCMVSLFASTDDPNQAPIRGASPNAGFDAPVDGSATRTEVPADPVSAEAPVPRDMIDESVLGG
ncbi:hypothetical protein EER27_13925 [Lysobacter psychrotolerans]|uniref:Uncharacterized protein n=2 Tax=Montanilutibacter psychrotolerans TaxID=1327343 RepID=A0A3M8SMZ5_9GAMM|nr:hypothetical protein EER27_13925 [Lysobacter psychrotolerans]